MRCPCRARVAPCSRTSFLLGQACLPPPFSRILSHAQFCLIFKEAAKLVFFRRFIALPMMLPLNRNELVVKANKFLPLHWVILFRLLNVFLCCMQVVVNVAKEKAPDAFWVGRAFLQGKEGDALKEVQEVIKGDTALVLGVRQNQMRVKSLPQQK
jgi:hypothetical protein